MLVIIFLVPTKEIFVNDYQKYKQTWVWLRSIYLQILYYDKP